MTSKANHWNDGCIHSDEVGCCPMTRLSPWLVKLLPQLFLPFETNVLTGMEFYNLLWMAVYYKLLFPLQKRCLSHFSMSLSLPPLPPSLSLQRTSYEFSITIHFKGWEFSNDFLSSFWTLKSGSLEIFPKTPLFCKVGGILTDTRAGFYWLR